MVNGDTFFEIDLNNLKEFHNKSKAIITICAFQSFETNRYSSIDYDNYGRVTNFGTVKNSINKKIICNGGVYIIEPKVYGFSEEFYNQKCSFENDIMNKLIIKTNGVFVKLFENRFLDIGLPNDYKIAYNILTMADIYES